MTDPITQIKQIIDDEATRIHNNHDNNDFGYIESRGFEKGAEFLLPLIERLVKQRNFIYKCYENDDIKHWSGSAQEFIAEDNQELINTLKGGEK